MNMTVATHLDIMFAISFCSQFLDKADQRYWSMVKHALQSIEEAANFGILDRYGLQPNTLDIYSDADYANDITTRKPVNGILFNYRGRTMAGKSFVMCIMNRHRVRVCSVLFC